MAKLMSVRKVLGTHYFVSRYNRKFTTTCFTLAVAHCRSDILRRCTKLLSLTRSTMAFAARRAKDVGGHAQGESVSTLITPKGFKLKAHLGGSKSSASYAA